MLTNKYLILVQLYESRSIKKAAEALSYSQSAVSQALQSIENELGVKLFIRRKNGLIVTNEGEQLYYRIKSIYDAENDLQQDVASLKGMISGEIKIGAYHTVACSILPSVIAEFNKMYPSITFNIKEGDNTEIRRWIETDKINFGILSLKENEDLITYPLLEDPFYVVLPADDPAARLERFDVQDFEDRDYIYLSECRDTNDIDAFDKYNITPKKFISVDQYETILAMVEQGLGISILPDLSILENYNIKKVLLDPPYHRNIGILANERQMNSIAVSTFIKFILDKVNPSDE